MIVMIVINMVVNMVIVLREALAGLYLLYRRIRLKLAMRSGVKQHVHRLITRKLSMVIPQTETQEITEM